MPRRVGYRRVPRRPIARALPYKARRRRIYKGKVGKLVPNVHMFRRVANYSNSGNLIRTGIITQSTDVLLLTLSSIGSAIQYGAGAVYFTLDAVPNSTEFTLLFDEYRIESVVIKFTPFWTQSLTAAAAVGTAGQTTVLWHDIFDEDDAGIPTATDAGINEMRQYNNYRVRTFVNGRPITKTMRPRTQGVAAITAGTIGSTANMTLPRKIFYDCNEPAIEYYGYKFICEASNSGANTVLYIKCEVTTTFTMKGVR